MQLYILRHKIFTFLILGIVLLGTACKKEPYLQTVEQTPYLGLPTAPLQIFQIDLADIRARDDYQQVKTQFEDSPGMGAFFKGMREQTGFDFLEQVDYLVLASKGPSDPKNPLKNMLFLAKGRFEKVPDALTKLPPYLGDRFLIAPAPFKKGEQAGFDRYQTSAQSQYDESVVYDINIGLPTPGLMAIAFSAEGLNNMLDIIGGKQQGIQSDKDWLELIKRVNTGSSIWGVGKVDPSSMQEAADAIPTLNGLTKTRQFYFNFSASGDVQAEIGLICETIDDATKLTEGLKASIEKLKPMFTMMATSAPTLAQLINKLFITTENQTSKITFTLPAQDLRQIQAEAEAMQTKAHPARTPAPKAK